MVSLPAIGYGEQRTPRGLHLVHATLRLATRVTAASEAMCDRIRAVGVAPERIVTGVDLARFRPLPCRPEGPPWRLLHIGSLNRVKDQPTLLKAFQAIRAAEPSAHLDIIGIDTLNGEIQSLAGVLGLRGAVTFHGYRRSDEVAAMLQQAHVLLHSSLSEMGPVAVLEAAACGVPTVGTAVGLISDLAPAAAVAVPVGDHRAMAEQALALLRNAPLRLAIAGRALAFARRCDADWTAARFEELYREATDTLRRQGT
jgi:glycosyltransferase involved in cell wall biosynthesis